ncbi:MAG: exopolysaccharide biosynthesis polyprenyl glycosylphosphotransferase [Candidatus Portnoybacteria bacterium]|nr:exopolysaccharide biosynthesis polyprenyl glycosylphosphotransferase [Candidatus Portnoybacteria bacterium]
MKVKKLILILGDIVMMYLALGLALALRYKGFDFGIFENHIVPFSIIYLIWIIVFYIHNLYDIDLAKNNIDFSSALIRAILVSALISLAFFYLVPGFVVSDITPKTNLFLDIIVFVILFYAWRSLFNFLVGSSKKINVAIVGYNPQAVELAKEIFKNPQKGYRLKVFFKNVGPDQIEGLEGVKIKNGFKNLKEILIEEKIEIAVIAPEINRSIELIETLFECIRHKIDVVNLPVFYEKFIKKIPISTINRVWFLENISQRPKFSYEKFKRFFDFVLGLIFLVVTIPVWLIIAILIKIDSPGPVFYTQKRIGKGGEEISIIKFRSMIKNAEANGAVRAEKKDKRITGVGRFLRRSRLDELPQFLNVIKGKMSLVGPRAERGEFHEKLQEEVPFFQERYLIKPGLTGWAQIKHGYISSLEDDFERVQYDLYYIKNRSFLLDLGIILKTINIVLRGGGR